MEDHVLRLLGHGPTGRFVHDAWILESGEGLDGDLGAMASGHEAHHAALNASSAWGGVLQALALAGRVSAHSERLGKVLATLVAVCRVTHEAYATHASVMDVLRASREASVNGLLGGYPEYQDYFRTALTLGPPRDTLSAWRQVAAESALQACMQSPALTVLLDTGLERFELASVRRQDHPDRRLALLAKTAPAWWEAVEEVAHDVLGDRWPVLSALSVRDPIARSPELTRTWIELRQMCIDTALHTLSRQGLNSLTLTEFRALLPGVVSELERLAGTGSHGFVIDTETASGAFSLFEMETVHHGPPRPADVRLLAGTHADQLLYHDPDGPHLYVTTRFARHLRARFQLQSGADLLTGDEPVTTVLSWHPNHERVGLYVISEPGMLQELPAIVPDGFPVLASISLACTQHQQWWNEWRPALKRYVEPTFLLDLPIIQSISAMLESSESFRYTLALFRYGNKQLFALAGRLADDPPVLLPCTITAGQAFVQYVQRKASGSLTPDLSALGDNADATRLVVAHLVNDERITGAVGG